MDPLHFGQTPDLPANLSLTLNRVWQPGHITWIGMGCSRIGGGARERDFDRVGLIHPVSVLQQIMN